MIMKMPDVISNSSCLISLDNIGMIHLLNDLYGKIYNTDEVLCSKSYIVNPSKVTQIEKSNRRYNVILLNAFRLKGIYSGFRPVPPVCAGIAAAVNGKQCVNYRNPIAVYFFLELCFILVKIFGKC